MLPGQKTASKKNHPIPTNPSKPTIAGTISSIETVTPQTN